MAQRVFKTNWFSKAAKKAQINEPELCRAATQVALGQADDLGGGVFKKRLSRNEHRAIVLAKVGNLWIYEYLFAKKDLENIDKAELDGFRMLVKSYNRLTEQQVQALLAEKAWTEICKEIEQ